MSNHRNSNPFKTNDTVNIVKGRYKGNRGTVIGEVANRSLLVRVGPKETAYILLSSVDWQDVKTARRTRAIEKVNAEYAAKGIDPIDWAWLKEGGAEGLTDAEADAWLGI